MMHQTSCINFSLHRLSFLVSPLVQMMGTVFKSRNRNWNQIILEPIPAIPNFFLKKR